MVYFIIPTQLGILAIVSKIQISIQHENSCPQSSRKLVHFLGGMNFPEVAKGGSDVCFLVTFARKNSVRGEENLLNLRWKTL